MTKGKKRTIMVSSTVYGIEELLERIYAILTAYGYEVWMSHKGTVPVLSERSAFENCINAVENCDLFMGIITPFYGSGFDETEGLSITHMELKKAIELKKLRWLLSHDHVVFAWSFLKNLGYETTKTRRTLNLERSNVFQNLKIIDMYEEAIFSQQHLRDRKGNWVQKFEKDEDALLFTSAQFSRFQEVESFINENISGKGGSK